MMFSFYAIWIAYELLCVNELRNRRIMTQKRIGVAGVDINGPVWFDVTSNLHKKTNIRMEY